MLVREAAEAIVRRLPPTWTLEVRDAVPPNLDGVFDLSGPGDERAEILVEVKSRLIPRDVPHIVSQLVRAAVGRPAANSALVVVAPYVSPRTQELLVASGAGYVDGTGC
jgi:hypothetical protein